MSEDEPTLDAAAAKREQRIKVAARRSALVLKSSLAQDPCAPELGMKLKLQCTVDASTGETVGTGLRMVLPDWDALALAATYARPFTLERDLIYGEKVANALTHFTSPGNNRDAVLQIVRMWKDMPIERVTFGSQLEGQESAQWSSGGVLGRKLLYSEIVHADDEHDFLKAFRQEDQRWALAAIVGDWLAVISHQEAWMHAIRPDLCPEVTPWAGDDQTIFHRLGA